MQHFVHNFVIIIFYFKVYLQIITAVRRSETRRGEGERRESCSDRDFCGPEISVNIVEFRVGKLQFFTNENIKFQILQGDLMTPGGGCPTLAMEGPGGRGGTRRRGGQGVPP